MMRSYPYQINEKRADTPLNAARWRFIKAAIDILGAVVALLLFAPLFVIIILALKKDGGPAFYGHTRIGRNGKAFKCWKFRSMCTNADQVLQDFLDKNPRAGMEWQQDFKLKNDPRITKLGRFLRETSLDELPQFYNVLRGEMSLVGPRPIVEDEKKFYGEAFADYISVKPGITGLWQVSGRNNISYEQRVHLDKHYIKNWSLWGDVIIKFKTLRVVLARDGAY